jgi:nitrogen-specific signal transduction histidine kinase
MNFFQTAILITLITNLVFGFIVISIKKKRRQNQGFFLLVTVLAVWLVCLFTAAYANSNEALAFWIKQSSASSALIPVALNILRLTLIHRDLSWPSLLMKSRNWIIAYPAVLALCQTSFFLYSAELPIGEQAVAAPNYGPGFFLFALYMVASVLVLIFSYVKDIRSSTGIQKVELEFVLVGCIIGFFVGVLLATLPTLTGVVELGQLLPLPVFAMDSILAYGVATRNLLDVPNVIRRILASIALLVYLGLLYFATWFGVDWVMQQMTDAQVPVPHFIATLVVALAMSPAQGRLQRIADQLFVKSPPLDVGKTIQEASRILNTISTVDELLSHFASLITRKLQSENLRIILLEDATFRIKFSVNVGTESLSIQPDGPLIRAMSEQSEPLVLDMIQRLRPTEALQQVEQRMRDLGVAALAGVRVKGQLIGLMLLGPRATTRIYGAVELAVLSGLADQLAISLENAKLYTEVQNSRIYNDILLDRLVGGVIAVNPARTITVFNREAERITGLSREHMLNADIVTLPPALALAFEQTFDQGGSRDVDCSLMVGDREVPIRFGCTLFHSYTGKVLGALVVFTDQTEIKKLEQQIRRTDRLASLGTLAAGMAHEIKNPLVSMKTFTQLLPERYDDPDFRDTFSNLLGDEVSRIDRIVNQLLRFARPAKPSLTPVNLHGIIDNTLNLVKQQLRQRNINLERQFEAGVDRIHGDSDMLAQALLNFFLNAIDAIAERGSLIVRTEMINVPTNQYDLWGQPVTVSRLRLSIQDNGPGIPPENLTHVFDPFFTTKASGTGLGLSVSHGIIHEHDGVIEVDSELGRGTTFHLIFPLITAEVSA